MDNKDHKPGGGDKKIESQKVAFKAQPKVGSRDNIKHKPGGGEIQVSQQPSRIYLVMMFTACANVSVYIQENKIAGVIVPWIVSI